MDRELLLEIGCEELPAGWLPGLTEQLGRVFASRLEAARIGIGALVETFSTPRRLVVRIAKVADRQTDLEEMITGPAVAAAYASDGTPTVAAVGFARKHGVELGALSRAKTPKGEYIALQKRQRGRPAAEVLPGILAAALRDLTFPKQMRWDAWLDDGGGELPFGRPIRWILYLYGGRVVPLEIQRSEMARCPAVQNVRSAAVTHGHRFLAPQGRPGRALKVRTFDEYVQRLSEHYVVLDRRERRDLIARALDAQVTRLGGRLWTAHDAPSSLLEEVPDLVEFPSVIAGTFPPDFLDLPDEVLTTTMIHHQHFFPVVGETGRLMPAFLAVINTEPSSSDIIARNAERVLTARLRDARFFWNADRQVPLPSRVDRLDTIVFHKALGSYRAKADRVAGLARHIAADVFGRPDAAQDAERAALLAKADLATEMVGELPELQGIMGGIYAREEGEPESVWKAIYYQYLPTAVDFDAPPTRGQLGEAAITWAAVALADKADTITGLLAAGERPSGSRDPFGLRRQMNGLLKVLIDLEEVTGLGVDVTLGSVFTSALDEFAEMKLDRARTEAWAAGFWLDRLRGALEQRGFDIREVRAVTHEAKPVDAMSPRALHRMLKDLSAFSQREEFQALAVLFKRVKNIARELRTTVAPDRAALEAPAELELLAALDARRSVIEQASATGRYSQAFAEIAALRPAVDRFFNEVFVMVDDERVRTARLALMAELRDIVLALADISEVVPQAETT